jgi:Zn-finger nucleic acid-binding protein
MKCPIDNTDLVMSDRQGIEIDYCPQCRGVWLDRGELDKIIERSANVPPPPPRQEQRYEQDRRPEPRRDERYDDRGHQKPRRRESFLGDIFDF